MERSLFKRILDKTNSIIIFFDRIPLWWLFFLLFALVFTPFLILGEGSIFEYHDQLDESMMNIVLTARHLGEGLDVLPEMMGGINASGLQPSAVLFVPLYCILPTFWAFLVQYAVCFAAAFLGMYFCVKELTGSSILAVTAAGCFCMLPLYPIYGLSEMGIPMVLYAFLRLWKKKAPWISLVLVVFFGLTSHLVCTGYVVLAFWGMALVITWLRRRKGSKWLVAAFCLLLGVYVIVNRSLFVDLLFSRSSYASHREEIVNYAQPFWETVKSVFLQSAQHAASQHQYLILPIVLLLVIGAFCLKRLSQKTRVRYWMAVGGFALLVAIALFYGLCKSQLIVDLKNSSDGFLRYFQAERFYWLYPAGWYLEFALCFSLWWGDPGRKLSGIRQSALLKVLVLVMVLLPTLQLLKVNSFLYMNINQINNGSNVTGYISWESYYAEDLMQELEGVIGRDMTTYRVAHLGICPAPALMHGFYTVDGYSNSYSLEYKHRFRQVIARELEKNEQTRLYFDEWGSRCYLFNSLSGNAWMIGKKDNMVYERLDFDMEALRDLGCEYLFSCGEIGNAEELEIQFMGYYETESSYWGVWLYRL